MVGVTFKRLCEAASLGKGSIADGLLQALDSYRSCHAMWFCFPRPISPGALNNGRGFHQVNSTWTRGVRLGKRSFGRLCRRLTFYVASEILTEPPPSPSFQVRIRSLPARHVAYIRVFNPIREAGLLGRLNACWSGRCSKVVR